MSRRVRIVNLSDTIDPAGFWSGGEYIEKDFLMFLCFNREPRSGKTAKVFVLVGSCSR